MSVELEIDMLLEAIYRRYQHDFRHYARASIRRRLSQAAAALGCETLSVLQHRVLSEEPAWQELFRFLTVQVSDLFRDPDFFQTLRRDVSPVLQTYRSLKVWVAGCARGEELYSLAILLREDGLLERSIIYATDIDPRALVAAERGIYDASRGASFSRAYQQAGGRGSLSDHCTVAYGAIVFDRRLRKNVVFSDHSLATDHVFAEVQLVTCRNVLIYFDFELQNRAVGLFTDALVRKGFLGIGARESLAGSASRGAYRELEGGHRLYQKV